MKEGEQVGEIDVLVGLIESIDDPERPGRLADRICEGVCQMTSLTRAVMFLHEKTLGISRPVGWHGVDESVIASVAATLDEMPLAQRVLAEDRVIEVSRNLEFELPARYAGMAGITTITCAPVAAGENWYGVIVADQGGEHYSLSEEDHRRVHTLGRLAAMASTVEHSTMSRERTRSLDARIGLMRDIHDRVVQRLFGLGLALGSEGELSPEEQRRCGEEVTSVLAQLREALASPVAPRERVQDRPVREVAEWYAQSPKVRLDWEQGLEIPARLDSLVQSALIEGMRNAGRHAEGGRIEIIVAARDDAIVVEVVNEIAAGETGANGSSRGGGIGLRLLTLEALQHDALIEFGPVGDGQWRLRLLAPGRD